MAKRMFEVDTELLFGKQTFLDATREELRVLIAVMADRSATDAAIAEAAGVSPARCRSALTLFEEEKVLKRGEAVSNEFESAIDEPDEDSAERVAKDIRDRGLASLISEFASLLDKPALSTGQVKKIVALNTTYSLSEEYILTLAAELADAGKLTVTRLVNEAIKLVEREIDTPETLQLYLEQKRKMTAIDIRMRAILQLNHRKITDSEHNLFEKWINEYGFSEQIIKRASDICCENIDKFSASYTDHILARWHETGCKTLDECLAQNERDRVALKAQRGKKAAKPKAEKDSNGTAAKYAGFSAEDALMRALERSYGSQED